VDEGGSHSAAPAGTATTDASVLVT